MKRIRGRRVALLICSALPLLAEEDVSVNVRVSQQESGEFLSRRQDWNATAGSAAAAAAEPAVDGASEEKEEKGSPYSTRIQLPDARTRRHYDRYDRGPSPPPYRPTTDAELSWLVNTKNQSVLPFHYPWEDYLVEAAGTSSPQPRDDSSPFYYDNTSGDEVSPYLSVQEALENINGTGKDGEPLKSGSTQEEGDEAGDGGSEASAEASDNETTTRIEATVDANSSNASTAAERDAETEATTSHSSKGGVAKQDSAAADVKQQQQQVTAVDYASKAVGALILDSSDSFQGASNLLQKDRDKYAIVPCEEENKYVVIGLSEDILVKQIVIMNYERYSSRMKDIHLSGSTNGHAWTELETYTTTPANGKQPFDLNEPTWARYLKFEFLSHYGDEHYCTVSQISVHGSTMLQGFHEQWAEEEELQHKGTKPDDEAALGIANGANNNGESSPVVEPLAVEDASAGSSQLKRSQEDSNAGTLDGCLSSSRFDHCFTALDAVCRTGQNFEKKMLLLSSGNASQFDWKAGALAAASVCLSSSDPVTSSRRSLSKPRLDLVKLNEPLGGRIQRQSKEGCASLVASASDKEKKSWGSLAGALAKSSPVVESLKLAILKTAEAVNVEEIGNKSLLRFNPASEDGTSFGNDAILASAESSADPVSDGSSDGSGENVSVAAVSQSTTESRSTSADGDAASTDAELSRGPAKAQKARPQQIDSAKVAGSEAPKKEDHEGVEDLRETDMQLAKVLQRLPSAKCLEKLDFAGFRANHLKTRTGGGGISGSGPHGGSTMEPIFKKLTDEIKALQANVAVHDQFAKESISCYQSILVEMLLEMESLRLNQDARISKIESDLQLAAWVAALQKVILALLLCVWSCLRVLYSWTSLPAWFANDNRERMTSALFMVTVVCLMALYRFRAGNSRTKSRTLASAFSPPVTPVPTNPITTTPQMKSRRNEQTVHSSAVPPGEPKSDNAIAVAEPTNPIVSPLLRSRLNEEIEPPSAFPKVEPERDIVIAAVQVSG